jgi:hypothetical protein
MPRTVLALALVGLSAVYAPGVRGEAITQSVSLPMTPTDFGRGGSAVLTVQPFDTQGGARVLDAVDLNVNAQIHNDFSMTFTTPATITTAVSADSSGAPGVLVTVDRPGTSTPLVSVRSSDDPWALTRTLTYGSGNGQTLPVTFSSTLPSSSPFYLAPALTQASNSLRLTSPADLSLFTGMSPVSLPVMGSAVSKFTTSSGNGSGAVTTQATADLTVTYQWHQAVPETPAKQTVPEPAAYLLWGLGGVGAWLVRRARRRAA